MRINSLRKKVYQYNNASIEVTWKRFLPKLQKRNSNQEVIIYLAGWSIEANSIPVVRLCSTLTKKFEKISYAIQTKPNKTITDSFYYEANTIKKMLEDFAPEIKKILLIAHSQGAVKMLYLANFLHEKSSPSLIGLVFITPVGLITFTSQQLITRFAGEIFKVLLKAGYEVILRKKDKYSLELTKAVVLYIRKEIKKDSISLYLSKLNMQLKQLTGVYPGIIDKLKKATIPLLLVTAEKDLVSPSIQIKNMFCKSKTSKSNVFEIKKSAHGLPYTHTKKTAEDIYRFLIKKW